ncbi:Hypothetical predicted protein [Mytilus galloprovincialis]|uniref:Uncharacterized protein n=1 Tax=Mytilus galloprovincialis TaxID=29158 RepID=A0A8B6DI79_MYTGA|nr:Hypothetical predicted protein [Mytilus galloprovincialis]
MAEVSGNGDISPLEDTLEDSSRDGEGQKPRAPTTSSGQTSTANGDKNTSESGNTLSQRQSSSTPSLSQRQSGSSTSQSQRQTRRSRDYDSESAGERDDEMSLQPGQNEVFGSGTESDNAGSNDEHLSSKAKKCLFDIFGEDAIAKKTEKKIGITMDDSQKEVLMGHWRALKPNLVSAFAEETKELFPVDEETEKFLQVPTLDDFIGNCLVKRHGSKASFF